MPPSQPTFEPTIDAFQAARSGKFLTVFCGPNNCGKSIVLKTLKRKRGRQAYLMGVVRFYHVLYFAPQQRQPNEIDQYESQFQTHFMNPQHNYEANYIDLNRIVTSLKDNKRSELFALCSSLIGNTFTMKRVEEDNELSMRYIDMDGQNVSIGSTGTRLLLTILGTCMDTRFNVIMIDEPELGLGPRAQNSLSKFFQNTEERKKYFPHLEEVYIATHSGLFLSRTDISDNFYVSKDGDLITLKQVDTIQEFHKLQFNLIGNDFETMFLPSCIVLVEGPTDCKYLSRILQLRYPDKRITVIGCSGDGEVKRKVHGLREAFGDLHISPFRGRIFVVLDAVRGPTIEDGLRKLGIVDDNIVVWIRNGIEYLYPVDLLAKIFACAPDQVVEGLQIDEDNVTVGDVTKRKNQLCDEVVAQVSNTTLFPDEINECLQRKIEQAIS